MLFFSVHISCWLRGHSDEDPSAFVKQIDFFFSFFKSMQVCITLEELWNKMTNGGDVLFLTGREPEHIRYYRFGIFLTTVLLYLTLSHLEKQVTCW